MAEIREGKPVPVDISAGRNQQDKVEIVDEVFESVIPPLRVPTPPSKRIRDLNIFLEWQNILDPELWKASLSMYLYRLLPKLDKKEGYKYIDVLSQPITEDYILNNHGSGRYLLLISDANKPKNTQKVCEVTFDLYRDDYPAKFDIGDLDVFHPDNKTLVNKLKAEGKIRPDGSINTMTPGAVNSDPAIIGLLSRMIDKMDRTQLANVKDPTDTALNKAFEVMSRGNEAAISMVLNQMKQDDPEKLLKMLEMMVRMNQPKDSIGDLVKIVELIKPNQQQDASLMRTLFEVTQKSQETQINLITKMMELATAKKDEDPFDKQLDRFLKLQELMGGSGGGKSKWYETALQYGAPLLERIAGVAQAYMMQRAGVVDANVVQQVATPNPAIQAPATPKQSRNMETAMTQSQEEQIGTAIRQYGGMLVAAINRGTPGDEFAASIDAMLGPESGVYNQIASLGKEGIMNVLKNDAQLWGILGKVEPKVTKFVDEFISYGEEEEPTEEQGEQK